MTLLEKAEKPQARSRGIPALILATLGTLGIVAFFFFGSRDLRGFDVVLLFFILGFTAYGLMNTIIRGLTTAVALYVATGIAATFYPILTPYARSFINFGAGRPPIGSVDYSALALSFTFIAVVLWIALEALFRTFFPATHLSFLGPVDRVAGALVHLVIGIVVATLVFTVFGYGVAGRPAHNKAALRPEFNQVMELYYQGQSFWFPRRPPPIYVYDLDLS
jgi:uncharacterized membrane protein required for colicin V production